MPAVWDVGFVLDRNFPQLRFVLGGRTLEATGNCAFGVLKRPDCLAVMRHTRLLRCCAWPFCRVGLDVQELLKSTWPSMLGSLSKPADKPKVYRERPLMRAMRTAGARVHAWRAQNALHDVVVAGGDRMHGLSGGTVSPSDAPVLQALISLGAVASVEALDAQLARAAVRVGVTLPSVVRSQARLSGVEYLAVLFPGTQMLGPAYAEDPLIGPHVTHRVEGTAWRLGRVPGSCGLFVSHRLYDVLVRIVTGRCGALLRSAQAVLTAEANSDEEAVEGDGVTDADPLGTEGEDEDGAEDANTGTPPGHAAGGDGAAYTHMSAGAEAGFFSCESNEERPGWAQDGNGCQVLCEQPAVLTQQRAVGVAALQPRQPFGNAGVAQNVEGSKQGKIDKFLRMSVGGGRPKSLHCVGGVAMQDKENAVGMQG